MTTTRSNTEQSPLDLDALSGHTSGPWLIRKGDEWTLDVATECVLLNGEVSLWNVASANKMRDESVANLRLIAAAPDLLALARTQAAELDQLRTSQKSLIEWINEAINFIVALKPERARFSLESAIKQSEEATLASAEVGNG